MMSSPESRPAPPEEADRDRYGRLRKAAGFGDRFRFVTEPRRDVYLAILHSMLRRRMAHEMEVYHDDLRDDCAELIRSLQSRDQDPTEFRADVEQLRRWGNISERVEPTRIRSLSDRGRSKLLLRMDPDTAAFLQFLDGLVDAVPPGLRDQGANLLADVHEDLKEAARELRQAGAMRAWEGEREGIEVSREKEETFQTLVLRASHLIHEADSRTDRVAAELVEFEDRLTRFVVEPFRIEDLSGLVQWMERYLDRYLSVLDERGLAIRRVLGQLSGPQLAPGLRAADAIEQRQMEQVPILGAVPVRLLGAADIVAGLRRFFDPQQGLAGICRRINRRTRDAIRRIQRHVEAVRLRNVRTETVRARLGELFALQPGPEGDRSALEFVGELVAAVGSRTDGRAGTPAQRALPPRPMRRYETARSDSRAAILQEKRGTPEQRRELETLRLVRLCRFMEDRVLMGRPEADLSEARLGGTEDSRTLIRALSAHFLAQGRNRPRLTYAVEPVRFGGRAVMAAPDHVLDAPESKVRFKAGAGSDSAVRPSEHEVGLKGDAT